MTERPLPANHELASKVQRAIAKIVFGMIMVTVVPAVLLISAIVNNGKPIEVGKPIPEFVLLDQNSERVSTADYLGHWCLVYFYNESRADGLIQARRFRESYNDFRKLDLDLVGISYDSIASHHQFAEQLNISHHLLSDPEGEVIEEYSAHTSMTKMTKNISYLVDEKGIVQKVYIDLPAEQQVHLVMKDIREFKHL